ncbi:MAG: tetratricopeptide repeat protein [Candidatus Riflebacteria bacterium]|nr:tetratricopeptide repeat protein [Candidatus Riflebacteria bacterium]
MEPGQPRTEPLEEESKEYKKALIFIRSGDWDKAREILEEYCQLNPKSARAFNKLAFVYLEMGDLEAAEEVLSGLLERGLKDFYTHFLYGRLLMRRGDVTNAVVHFTTALTINPKDVYTLNGVAEALLIQGDRPKAIRCLKKAIELAPDDMLSYGNLCQHYVDSGEPDLAAPIVELALTKSPKDSRMLFLHGRCMLAKEDLAGARRGFEELAQAYPGQAWGKLGLGMTCEAGGDLAGAAREMAAAVAADPKHLEAHERLSLIYSKQGEREKALAAMEKAIQLAPFDLRIQTRYARALYERRLVLKAWLKLQSVLAQDENYVPGRILRSMLYLDEDLPARSDEDLVKILEKDPENPEALTLHAECLALTGHPEDAEALVADAGSKGADPRHLDLVRALARRAAGDEKGFRSLLKALEDPQATDRVSLRVKKLARK